MAEYSFLLGSGISLESGVQRVGEITEALFGENYWEHTDQSIIRGQHPSEHLRDYYDVSEIQDFLKLLFDETNQYLKDRLGKNFEANYEDLYDVVQQLNQEAVVSRDNVAIKPFFETIKEKSLKIRSGYRGFDEPVDMNRFTYKTMGFIESVIKYGLNEKELDGLDVLDQLIEKEQGLNLFTLNHDLLLEKLCIRKGTSYSDGFSERDRDIRWYQPSVWDSDSQVRIYKLHGSRNWFLVRHRERGQTHAIIVGGDHWHSYDSNGERVQFLLDRGHILTGQRKSENYYSGIHGEIHYRFSNHLRSCNNLIVSGYGWNDIQMNWKLFDWLDSHDENKMIIIHEKPVEMAENSRQLTYRTFSGYQQRGKIEFIEKWFQDVELEDIVNYKSVFSRSER